MIQEITREDFEFAIEAHTGKKLGTDYGIITGTSCPFKMNGFLSAAMIQGFKIFKYDEAELNELHIKVNDPEEFMPKIVEFLK